MLGTDNTLRSGHFLLLLLVASSIILGLGYLNEMYQRIQLQTDLAIMERQTHNAASERSAIQHNALQLQIKLEAVNQEKKRLHDIHEFQAQQQSANYEREKQELLKDRSLKEKEIAALKDQYESLKVRFDNLHSVMEQFEKNQSRLLEKFSTQSTQCMNVITMMSELCSKSKVNIHKILPFLKSKTSSTTASISQSSAATNKPENIQTKSPEGGSVKVPIPLLYNRAEIPFLSGGKQRYLTSAPEMNDLHVKPESTVSSRNTQYNDLVSTKEKAQKTMASAPEQTQAVLQNNNFQNESNVDEMIIKNGINVNSTKPQSNKKTWLFNFQKNIQNNVKKIIYSEDESNGLALKNQSSQLTNSTNPSSSAVTNTSQDGDWRQLKNTTSQDKSEDKTPKNTIKTATKEAPPVNKDNALNSLLDALHAEDEEDADIKEENINSEEHYLKDLETEIKEDKILQILK